MVLSKPLQQSLLDFVSFYLQNLYLHPLRTKSITSGVIASLGNFTSQIIANGANPKSFNQDSLVAFALFGFLFSGPLPHYFYSALEKFLPSTSTGALMKLLCERLLFTPLYQAFSLYALARLELKGHDESYKQMMKLYLPVLEANLKYRTLFQFINMYFVPPMLRVLFVNIVGFFWTIYIALKRKQAEESMKRKDTST